MTKTALILGEDRNGLQHVYGMPAARRLILLVRLLGFDRIHLIGRDQRIFSAVSDLVASDAFHSLENGSDACSVVQKLSFNEDESVLVLRANHVIDRWSLSRLLQAGPGQEISILKNREKESHNAIFLVKASRLLPLLASLQRPGGPETEFAGHMVHVNSAHGLPELLDGARAKARAAEEGLTAAVADATWHRDSILSRYLNRPISQVLSPALARTWVTPNMVTLLNTVIGLAGAYLILRGGYLSQIAGSLLFLLCTIVDGIDGEIARLKLQETSFGGHFDVICDNVVHVAIFVAIGLALYHETANGLYLYLLLFLLCGFGLCALLINRILTRDKTESQPTRTEVLLEYIFNNRDFAYIVTGFALFRHLDWFFTASTFGIYVLNGILWGARLTSRFNRQKQAAAR
jgi:phosphatidylglycerophosphate synthase